jgi:undecaprenyl-diphosphatase
MMGKKRVKSWLFDKREAIFIAVLSALGILSLLFFDESLALFFRSIQTPYLSFFLSIFRPISVIVLFGIIAVMLLWKEHRRKLIWPFALSIIISAVLSFAIKFLIMRERPFGLEETIALTNLKDYSFPSSHAMAIFSALPILDKEFKRFRWVFIAIACLIALSRLYFNAHYLSDVIFGGIFGYAVGKIVLRISENKNKR